MDKDSFVLPDRRKQKVTDGKDRIIKLPIKGYNLLVEMSNQSGLSMREIAARAIEYAYSHLEYMICGED